MHAVISQHISIEETFKQQKRMTNRVNANAIVTEVSRNVCFLLNKKNTTKMEFLHIYLISFTEENKNLI